MNLLDFLIQLLITQGQTLQRLAAFFGEEELLQMLETAGETMSEVTLPFNLADALEKPLSGDSSSAYARLEGTVREMKLPAVLEFHLWAYPFYRSIIESPINLKSSFRTGHANGEMLVNESLAQAKHWIKNLPIHPDFSAQAERAALIPWIRFRSELLKKIGKRPFVPILVPKE